MTRVLHIARYDTVSIERRVMEMARRPGFAFRLVRPLPVGDPFDAEIIRDRHALEGVRLVRIWAGADPHRGLYHTLGFGAGRAFPDIIHAEEEPDSLAALQVCAARRLLAPRSRLVLSTWQNVNRRKPPAVRGVLKWTLAAADAVVCGNQGAVGVLRELGYEGPAPVLPALTLDSTIYSRRPVPRFSPGFTIGCIARLATEKGVDILLRAVAALGPPVMVMIVGTGPLREALAALARSLDIGSSVVFLGARDPGGVAEFLSAIDLLVVPSRSSPVWKEQFGRVIVEAMGCEVPVVGSASGAIPEVIGGAGVLFPEGDVDALAEHLRQLRASPARRADLARRGRDWAMSAHDPSRRATETLEFYGRLLGNGCRRRG